MRLINFGVGEVADRLTILSLKLLHSPAHPDILETFKAEQDALLDRMRTVAGQPLRYVLALGAVNSALWHAEDALRRLHTPLADEAADDARLRDAGRIALRIQTLNDTRASLVAAINNDDYQEKIR